MAFTKFTHTLLKHCQASRRPNIECAKCEKRELSDRLFENVTFLEKNLFLC